MRFRHHDNDLAKTLSFGVIHIAIAITLGWLLAGTFVFGALLALIEPVVNTAVSHRIGKRLAGLGHSRRATFVKASLIGIAHLVVAVSLARLLTGSFVTAWTFALIEPMANAVAHYAFERWWHRGAAQAPALSAGWARGARALSAARPCRRR